MTGQMQGKCWGKTRCVLMNDFCELHHVFAKKGGVCSKHYHKFKSNLFLVIKGKLLVKVWKNDMIDEVILTDGEYTSVSANDYHLFEALEDTEFIENYTPVGIGNDIIRETQGFMKNDKTL